MTKKFPGFFWKTLNRLKPFSLNEMSRFQAVSKKFEKGVDFLNGHGKVPTVMRGL